ncbi:helix-turn-helix domain-containing protein [Trinickia dinghuensis]|uniref:Helix-turn-helix domain-containing protein n=1 Tax=Trinickia dinghuensis TaxID=2291023 RepID=A0A3D8JUB4_9BURK|nr:helix-turn-helix domain-containing protein [Trinickia dinghuensis]RDU96236.1 helix-turn-helix domain-containing protein [Trinickia dinghuensis]
MLRLDDRIFSDAGEHAALLAGWDQQYFQLDSGCFRSTLQQINTDDIHLFHESVNRRIVQRGSTPRDTVAFGIVLDAQEPVTFSGQSVQKDSVIFGRSNCDFFMHFPSGAELLGIAISQSQLDGNPRLAERVRTLTTTHAATLPVASDTRQHILGFWHRFVDEARAWIELADPALAERCVSTQLVELLDLMLDGARDDRDADITWMSHSDIVARVHRMLVEHPQEPVTVQQISEALRISRRTVQNSFRLVTNKSPIEYMRAVRLNFVRQMLRTSHPSELTVRDAAQHWGFFHSGHFTQDYRKLFDAAPSDNRPH